jgi:molecular chaperone GrpE
MTAMPKRFSIGSSKALSSSLRAMRRFCRWSFEKVIAPTLRHTANRMLGWSAVKRPPSDSPEQWKQQALEDFSVWLTSLPAVMPDGEPGPQACDLYTLLTEFAALRQEIKLQARQQRTTLRGQESRIDRFQRIAEQFDACIAHLDQVHDAIGRRIEETTVQPFLDIRDALVRGETAALKIARTRGFWRRPPSGTDAVAEGYTMALRRFDRALDRLGIKPIAALGQPFDAACMRAVETRRVRDQDQGIVIEEIAGGFIRAGQVMRTAEVIVNKK